MKIAISIDLGGTSTKVALINKEFKIISRTTIAAKKYHSEAAFFQQLNEVILETLNNTDYSYELIGIGIGTPSCNDEEGVIIQAANLPFSPRVEIVKILKEQYQVPVFLINDANAACLGEWRFGAGKGKKNFLMMTLGTGLGGAMIINEKLVKGSGGFAAEFGHIRIEGNKRMCGCGRKGCLETYVSATGLKRTALELQVLSKKESKMRDISFNDLDAKNIFKLAMEGDELAREAFLITGDALGNKLADLIAISEPEAVVLTGGLAEAGSLLFSPAEESLNRNILSLYKGRVSILESHFKNNEGALLGAASLAWDYHETFSKGYLEKQIISS